MHTWYPLISVSGVIHNPTWPIIAYLFCLNMNVLYRSVVSSSILVVSNLSNDKATEANPRMLDARMTRRLVLCQVC